MAASFLAGLTSLMALARKRFSLVRVLKLLYLLATFLVTIHGVLDIYKSYFSLNSPYQMSLTVEKESVRPQLQTPTFRPYIEHRGHPKTIATEMVLANSGKRAIARTFLLRPIQVSFNEPNLNIYSIKTEHPDEQRLVRVGDKKNEFFIRFNLLNPQETIPFTVFSNKELKRYVVHSRIRDISRIHVINRIHSTTWDTRIAHISLWWFATMVYAVVMFVDCIVLLSGDVQLQRILTYAKNLQVGLDPLVLTSNLGMLYDEYRTTQNFMFISKETFRSGVNDQLKATDLGDPQSIAALDYQIVRLIRNGNLYNLRVSAIVVAPTLFLIGLGGAIISFIW